MALVCIVNQGSTHVNMAALQELKLREVANSIPDLIFSGGSTTAAFLLFTSLSETLPKVEKLVRSFKHAFVLLPHQLLGDAAVTEAVCRLATETNLTTAFLPNSADFTTEAVRLSKSVFVAAGHKAEWRNEQAKEVQTAAAINGVLSGLPLPAGADPMHVSNMLRMLGSMQHLAQAHPQQIAAHTGLDIVSAAEICAFFRRP